MKNMITKAVVAGTVAAVAGSVIAEGEVSTNTVFKSNVPATTGSVTADFASAYVFRGVTLNDGAVFQPGMEVSGFGLEEKYGSITVGVWGNYAFSSYAPAGVSGSTSQETDWYGSYGLPTLVEGLDLFIGYTEYTYGGSSDKEVNLGAGYEVAGIGLGLTWYQGVGGLIGSQTYIEATMGYALDISDTLSASLDASAAFIDAAKTGFNDYSIGGSISYVLTEAWSVGASLAYIGQGEGNVLGDSTAGGAGYDVSVLGVLSVGASF